jgi:hypothetical protein
LCFDGFNALTSIVNVVTISPCCIINNLFHGGIVLFQSITKYLVLTVTIMSMLFMTGCGGESGTIEGPSLTEGRWGHTATKLPDGRILILGGQSKPSKRLASAELFDPASSTFSSAASMSDERGVGLSSVLLNNGTVLVFGDTDNGSAEIYDPSTGTWSATGSMNSPRRSSSANLLDDGRVLVAGGADVTKSGDVQFASSEIYDPSSGEWTITGDMLEIHSGQGSIVIDGKVIIFGQFLSEMYDSSTGVWSSIGIPAVERSRGTGVIMLKDGTVMIAGGEWKQPGWQGQTHVMATIQTFDSASNVFSSEAIPSMTKPKYYPSAFLQDNGEVLVVGTAIIELYSPATNLWTTVATLLLDRGTDNVGSPTATELDDGRILVVGGKQETDDKKFIGILSSEIYDPSAVE